MEPQDKMDTQQLIIDRLQDIHVKAVASNFADALTSMKEVKTADPKNIYIIAIEKQIAKLNDPSLQAENRAAIIKSLPPMIDRAISDVQRRAVAPKVDDSQKVQKEAALEKLKSQYFQRSDDYVEKKEYQRALEEIRRIYIIEPGSVVAKEYEKKIEQLAALQARGDLQEKPAEEIKESKIITPVAEAKKENVIVAEKSNKSIMIGIAAAVVVIIAVGVWFILSNSSKNQPIDQGLVQQPAISQESATPILPTTTTSTPQSGKESDAAVETSKQQAKIQKTTPEIVKPVTTEQKAVPPPAITPPVRTQTQQQQPQPQQQAPPVVNTPPPAPVQQQPKIVESTPAPKPFVAVENPPEVIRREPAKYPEIALKMGLKGRVYVEVSIDAQGKPIQTKIVKSESDVFNSAASEAVMKYTFKPAMMSTGPVSSKMTIPIDFRIK